MTNNCEKLLSLLKEKGYTIGCAESFTAGLFASTFCSISGASIAFKGGIICYNRSIKENVLSVPKELIDTYGVVSKEVAFSLSESAKNVLDVDIAVSFTGNAGPTAEIGKAKVGAAYIGIDFLGKTETYKKIFEGDRNQIREEAVEFAIDKLIEKLI